VIVPYRFRIERLPRLLQSKERWIINNLERYSHSQPVSAAKELRSGDTVPYLGRDLKLCQREGHRSNGSITLEGAILAIGPGLFNNGMLQAALEQWYRIEAARLITNKAEQLSSQMGISYKRIFIRGQKTRWGSCSHKKNLSFNWKLIMAPEPVIDYVIIHELAHLKEMNHSKKFWELVARYCPRWREYRKWLKQHEVDLTARLCT